MDPQDEVLAQRVGQTIGDWTLHRLIGAGGMAVVYAAANPDGRAVAIKLLRPEMALRREIRDRFLREAAVMSRIQHPGMVAIHEQGQIGDLVYLAMELLTGETVADRVRRLGRLEPREVLVIVDQVLDVLAVAHGMGIVHRDLKPENLFLTQSGRIKVLDFGLARLLDASPQNFLTRTGAALGTLPYMAPEQALGRRDEIDARTDLFAVGATAFRLLTGRRIHEAPSEAELLMCMASVPAKGLRAVAPDLPTDLAAVVDRALAFAKSRRYPNAVTMQRDVQALLADQPPPFAVLSRENDDAKTRIDSPAANPLIATSGEPNSTRPLHAAIAEPPAASPTISERLPPTAFDAVARPLVPEPTPASAADAAIPHSQRVLPPTVAMAASSRDAATIAERIVATAAPGASIPIAPMSDVALKRTRRRTLLVGLIILFGMLGAVTAVTAYLVARQSSAAPATSASSATSGARVGSDEATVTPTASPSTHHDHATLRHPAHIMAPIEEPALESADPARPKVPDRRGPAASSRQRPSPSPTAIPAGRLRP